MERELLWVGFISAGLEFVIVMQEPPCAREAPFTEETLQGIIRLEFNTWRRIQLYRNVGSDPRVRQMCISDGMISPFPKARRRAHPRAREGQRRIRAEALLEVTMRLYLLVGSIEPFLDGPPPSIFVLDFL